MARTDSALAVTVAIACFCVAAVRTGLRNTTSGLSLGHGLAGAPGCDVEANVTRGSLRDAVSTSTLPSALTRLVVAELEA
jgi:hypothetical protein